jgi:uncharacterized protein YbaA (DUF1428 family)
MTYVDGFVAAVADGGMDAYVAHARETGALFRELGALRVVDCWGDDVPDGTRTDFRRAVQAAPGETVVFGWIEWPSKEVRDAGMRALRDDPRMRDMSMPFDGARMIYGGFRMVAEAG